jgi:translation initiation factor IF-3
MVDGGAGAPQRKEAGIIQQSFVRANHKIKVSMVRCLDFAGNMMGVIATKEALRMAQDQGLDLVEVSPNADPPVCRIMDFGKFRYDDSIRRKKARQQAVAHNKSLKEIKFHANVEEHDYQTKVRHAREFLEAGHKVRLTLQFRGRENVHRELGMNVVKRVLKDCGDLSVTEMEPRLMGRSLVALMGARPPKTSSKKLDAAAAVV